MNKLESFNGPRKTGTGPQREPEYLCHRCPTADKKWRSGGATELGLHQAVHGGAEAFPAFELIDAEGFIIDFEGVRLKVDRRPVTASTTVTGWVRSRPRILVPPYTDREGR